MATRAGLAFAPLRQLGILRLCAIGRRVVDSVHRRVVSGKFRTCAALPGPREDAAPPAAAAAASAAGSSSRGKRRAPVRGNKLVILGLGNPGPQFENTRHNIGFVVATDFAERNRAGPFKFDRRFNADVTAVRAMGKTIHVVKPRTFMNQSGQALRAVMEYYGVSAADVIVVADDMALDLGQVRVRAKGSAGGHNGLKSVEKHLGGGDYARLKVGVGEPRGGADRWSDHVLGKFKRGDAEALDKMVWDCNDILDEWVVETDVGRIMNAVVNKKNTQRTGKR